MFAWAQAQERAEVTDNVGDYMQLHVEYIGGGNGHVGLIFTSNDKFPRGQPATVGQLVTALDRFLRDDAPRLAEMASFVRWL